MVKNMLYAVKKQKNDNTFLELCGGWRNSDFFHYYIVEEKTNKIIYDFKDNVNYDFIEKFFYGFTK